MMTTKRGFALITVLWVVVVASVIAAAGAAAGGDAIAAARNRVSATRSYWYANACAEWGRYAIDRVLSDAPPESRDSLWRTIGAVLAAESERRNASCRLRVAAAGSTLNVNAASAMELERLFEAAGFGAPAELSAALMDWIDADDIVRAGGGESASYVAAGGRPPRNGFLADIDELRYVRGFAGLELDSLLGVDTARVSLATAPLPVLAALPGFSSEAVARAAEWRLVGRQLSNLLTFAGSLSPSGSAALIAWFPELSRRTTVDPEAWFLLSEGAAGRPAVESTVELRVIRAGSRAVVERRRVW